MRINHNISGLLAYNTAVWGQANLKKSMQKLSTGLRINSAADDASGLAVSEKMRAQTRGLDQAARNGQDGISMIQTAEGALREVHSILQRMRELSVQAANDTLISQDRGYIQTEVDQLKEEINRIANTTQFNKRKLLDGSSAVLWSSDKLTTEALVHGGLTAADQFGQKVSAEGNYKIEISASPGKAQVLKSNIMDAAELKTVTTSTVTDKRTENDSETVVRNTPPVQPTTSTTRAVAGNVVTTIVETVVETVEATIPGTPVFNYFININTGRDNNTANDPLGETSGEGWSFTGGVLTIDDNTGRTFRVVGSGAATTNRIVVQSGSRANIFLENVNIDVSAAAGACAFGMAGAAIWRARIR